MQNKNRVLKRGGFAVIAAVFMMLLITLMLLKMLSYSTDVATRTSNEYLYEQAQLLAFNATEDAVYTISGINPYTTNCVTSQNYTYASMLDINITIRYIWSNGLTPPTTSANCLNYIDVYQAATENQLDSNISNGAALIDVYVSSTPSLGLDEPIRFHRRTLQKL